MIRIHVLESNNFIKKIIIKGHANYEEYGKDIVCAAVSATYLCTVNACISIQENSIEVLSMEDKQEILVKSTDVIIQKLLHNMVACLLDLEEQYPKNIKLDKEEK